MRSEEAKYLAYLSRYLTSAIFKILKHLQTGGHFPAFQEINSTEANYKRYTEAITIEVRKQLMNSEVNREGKSRLSFARDVDNFDSLVNRLIEQIESGLIPIP
jgi:hypothetical protein